MTSNTMFPQSLHPLLCPCANEQVCASSVLYLVPLMQPSSHCAKHSTIIVITITSQTSQHGPHTSSLHTDGNLRVPDWGSRVDKVTLSKKLYDGLPSLETCVRPCTAMLKQDLCRILVRPNSSEALPEFCHHHVVGVRADCLPSFHCIHKDHSFTMPQDSNHDLAH